MDAPSQQYGPLTPLGAVALIGVALHLTVGDSGPLTVAAHATAGWWWLICGVSAIAAAASRDRVAAVLCAVAALVSAAWTVPGTLGSAPEADGPVLSVVVGNLLSSNPEIDGMVEAMLADDPDVVALIEVPTTLEPLDGARWVPRQDNFGIALRVRGGTEPEVPPGRDRPLALVHGRRRRRAGRGPGRPHPAARGPRTITGSGPHSWTGSVVDPRTAVLGSCSAT